MDSSADIDIGYLVGLCILAGALAAAAFVWKFQFSMGANPVKMHGLVSTTPSPQGLAALQGGTRHSPWKAQPLETEVLSVERNWTEPVHSEVVQQPVHEIQVFAQCLTGRLLVFRVPEQVTYSTLVSTLSNLTDVPAQLFYVTLDGRRLSHDSVTVVNLFSGQTVRTHGRLRCGATPVGGLVETEWFCVACNRGGCWPTKQRCFRCNLPRVESDRMRGVPSFPPKGGKGKGQQQREAQFLGRAPLPGPQFSMAPTWRHPKKAKKTTADAPLPLTPSVDVVGLLRSLGCSEAVLAEVQGRLAPEPKVRTPGERALKLAEIETALHKAKRHELILMEQLEAQERKIRSTKATLSEQSQKVALLEAEAQEAKRLVAEGPPS